MVRKKSTVCKNTKVLIILHSNIHCKRALQSLNERLQKEPKLLNNDALSWNKWFELITGNAIVGGAYVLALSISESSIKHDLS